MTHYICLLTPARAGMHGKLTADEGEVFRAHSQYLKSLFDEQTVLQAGTSFEPGDDGFALVILAADDKAKAVALMSADPAVAKGLLRARVTEYDIFLDRGLAPG